MDLYQAHSEFSLVPVTYLKVRLIDRDWKVCLCLLTTKVRDEK